jgi:hypothetical protein
VRPAGAEPDDLPSGCAELVRGTLEEASDVGGGSEPELPAVSQGGGERFRHEEAGTAEPGGEDGSIVEQGSRTVRTSGWGRRMLSTTAGLAWANS